MSRATTDVETLEPGGVVLSAVVGGVLAAAGFVIGIGMTGVAPESTAFWYLSRGSGFVAYVLLCGSVTWFLLLSTGIGRAWARPQQLLDVHQFLSFAGAGFSCFHALVLTGDRYLSFPLQAILVPFAGRYEPLLVAMGQIALWLTLLVIGSFYVRRQIGGRAWRRLHYAAFAAFWLAFFHAVLVGTESRTVWAQIVYYATAAPVIFFTLHRILTTRRLSDMIARHQ